MKAATAEDLAKVRTLLLEYSLPLDGLGQTRVWLAKKENEIVGCVGLEVLEFQGLLRSLAVRADSQGKGVGAELVRKVMKEARERAVKELHLLTNDAEEYFKRFYFSALTPSEKAKFHGPITKSSEFLGAYPDTSVLMKKTI